MKKHSKKLLAICCICICSLAILNGCNTTGGRDERNNRNTVQTIKEIEVWTAAKNESHIYHVKYPYYYYYFEPSSDGSVKSSLWDFEGATESSDLTEEETAYFVDYLTNLPKEEASEDSSLSYQVYLRYCDENGEEQSKHIKGYDTFPQGWDEFVMRYNESCGGNYLSVNEEIQEVTPEFLTEVFGVTDDDVRDGTLQDVIDEQELDIVKVTELFHIQDALDSYYASTKEEVLNPYRPTELKAIDSTEEEYDAFVKEYLKRLGTDEWKEIESDQNYLRELVSTTASEYLYVGRTVDLEKLEICPPVISGEYYQVELDAHMEEMTYSTNFIYSADGKYILVFTRENPDMLLPFVEGQK